MLITGSRNTYVPVVKFSGWLILNAWISLGGVVGCAEMKPSGLVKGIVPGRGAE